MRKAENLSWTLTQETADLVAFIEEILMENLVFCAVFLIFTLI